MNFTFFKSASPRRFEKGFSVVEMLIAMTVFLIVLASVYGVLRIGNISRSTINYRSEIIRNARLAINSIGRDAVNAGFGYSRTGGIVPNNFSHNTLNIPAVANTNRELLTAIISSSNVSESDLSNAGEKNDVIAFAFRDQYFNGGSPVIVSNAGVKDNSIVLQTNSGGCAECKPFDLYLLESADNKQVVAMATDIPDSNTIVVGVGDPLNLNQPADGDSDSKSLLNKCGIGETANCFSYTPQATAKKIYWISYSVDVNGTLVRTSYGNNTGAAAADQIQRQPLAYGIQSFKIRYLMKDGTVTADPSEGNTNQANLNNIVQIEVSAVVKTENNQNGFVQTDLVNLSSTFSTRNLNYDVE